MAPRGEAKKRTQYVEQITTQDQIKEEVAKLFQESQSSVAGHKKQVLMLKAIQYRAFQLGQEAFFNYIFCRLINKVLVVKRVETVGDRVVKFVSSFIALVQADYVDDEDPETDEIQDNLFNRFVRTFVNHLLRGIEAKDKNVRYRVVQFLDFTMQALGIIDSDLYQTLTFALNERLKDKEPHIRAKALHCIARFQEEPDEESDVIDDDGQTAKLLTAIQNDPAAEVRRAALLNVTVSNITKHYILERARDINPINRRIVYSRSVKSFGDFRTIDRRTRERLLAWGLKDRDESVQKACVKMFSQDWLLQLDGDLIELLQRLHIMESDVADLAMKHFFQNRKDLVPMIKFPEDKWENLDPEISYLARSFYHHCLLNKLNDLIEENFPESARLAELLTRYLQLRKDSQDEDEIRDREFIIENLLTIAVDYDFSDEIGRRSMLHTVRSTLSNDNLPDKLNKVALQVLRKLSINENDFCSMVSEMVYDIRDEAGGFGDVTEPEKETVFLHCMSLCKHMLALTNEPSRDNLSVGTLIDTIIVPAMGYSSPALRLITCETVGLCCLLNLDFAKERFIYFGICLAKGTDELKIVALKAMFDILSIHGTKVLDVEDGVDTLSFHRLLYKTLKTPEIPELQALCAEGLCKLFLADIMTDDELFETLVMTYYDTSSSSNQSLLQAFTFCLPVYCFSHPQHQMRMSNISTDAFKRICEAQAEDGEGDDENKDENMISPTLILQQLIHWTDPVNVVNQSQEDIEKSTTHYNFLVDLLSSIEDRLNKKYRRAIFTQLNRFSIYPSLGYDKLLVIDGLLKSLEETVAGQASTSRTSYSKFVKKLDTILEEAEKLKDDEVEEDDREFSRILEEANVEENKEEKINKDEIDEEYEEEQSRLILEDLDKSGRENDADENEEFATPPEIITKDIDDANSSLIPLEQGTPTKSNRTTIRLEDDDDVDEIVNDAQAITGAKIDHDEDGDVSMEI